MATTSLVERPAISNEDTTAGFLYAAAAYLLWGDDETSSVVQFAGGQFTTLGTWQRSLVALASQR